MAEAEEAWRSADRLHGLFMLALNSELAGEVRWLQRGLYRVGVCRATSACGGVVIVVFSTGEQRPLAEVHYLDEWAAAVLGRPPSSDPDDVALYELAVKAKALRDELARGAAGGGV
jgi:hypothetical protein